MNVFDKSKLLISKIFNKSNSFYPSRYYYHAVLNRHNNGVFYNGLIKSIENYGNIKTSKNIKLLKNKSLNSTTLKDVKRKFGRFNNRIINDELYDVKVLLYKHKIGRYKAKMELHFYKNRLFFYAYTFSYINMDEKEEIINIIKDKYLKVDSVNLFDKYIVDQNENIMMINDKIEFSIYYLVNNQEAMDSFLEYRKNKNKLSESVEKKHKSTLYRRL